MTLPLFARRVRIEGTLEVLSPLHVGSGENEPDSAIALVPGETQHPESARVQRDARERSYIPGTSIKGALRAAAHTAGEQEETVARLFGDIKDASRGVMGALTIFGAEFLAAPRSSGRPAFAAKKGNKSGLALAARTAIDPGRGIVEDKKLFHVEEVVPGTTFTFRARYQPTGDGSREADARQLLGRLLSLMAQEIALGSSTADGAGRVRLRQDQITIASEILGPDGEFEPDASFGLETDGEPRLGPRGRRYELTLSGDGPFFVNDWSREKKKKKTPREDDDEQGSQLVALRESMTASRDGGRPILPGTSLMGALHSRAAWLEALMLARCKVEFQGCVDRLFGTQKRKARLVLDNLELAADSPSMKLTSVRLDRFSGSPIDGALFSVDCFVDPVFRAKLRVVPDKDSGQDKQNESFVEILMNDLKANGLMLGHAGNRGFGWFRVQSHVLSSRR